MLVTVAFAVREVHRCEEASRFVRLMNSIMAKTNATYKQRMAQHKKKLKVMYLSS